MTPEGKTGSKCEEAWSRSMTNLTITKIKFMHGECDESECPVCRWWTPKGGATPKTMAWNKKRVTEWLKARLTVLPARSKPDSPWWNVEEENGDCYRKLRGNLRNPGYYDEHPEAQ